MIQASIDSVLHKALVDDSASSSARGYDAVAFVDMAGNMQPPGLQPGTIPLSGIVCGVVRDAVQLQ